MQLVGFIVFLLICAVCWTTDSQDITARKLTHLLKYLALREEIQAVEEVQKELQYITPYVITCEGEKGWVQCKQYEIINIIKAFWGRDDHVTCTSVPAGLTSDRLCETNMENTLLKVNSQCKNEQACEVVASNIFFDDNSCGNVYKYLKVWYECIPDEANAVDIL
ncbi:L-rhamnose-binding lectin SML-like [Amphiura filiformis]|uniref:L-rhamnose-binding lectin SML-like n=1 Tax=Amphiura filiformis TaxID=82378 RepID=UPI003B20F5BB